MARTWDSQQFDSVYERFICQQEFPFGGLDYYRRYRSRYKECIRRFAALASAHPLDVLDIGGGQLALMCAKLWNDRGVAADLPGPHLDYIASHGIETLNWNLCKSDPPCAGKFDFVFFSEVIEHLPIPGYLVLERIRKILRPGGVIICTTPNLYRLRNVVYMALGKQIFDYFQYPEEDVALLHLRGELGLGRCQLARVGVIHQDGAESPWVVEEHAVVCAFRAEVDEALERGGVGIVQRVRLLRDE